MSKSYKVYSRYGQEYSIDYEFESWYFDASKSYYVRSAYKTLDGREVIDFVDPDGGPFISLDASLKTYHPDLPDLTISSIEYDEATKKYKLGVK